MYNNTIFQILGFEIKCEQMDHYPLNTKCLGEKKN